MDRPQRQRVGPCVALVAMLLGCSTPSPQSSATRPNDEPVSTPAISNAGTPADEPEASAKEPTPTPTSAAEPEPEPEPDIESGPEPDVEPESESESDAEVEGSSTSTTKRTRRCYPYMPARSGKCRTRCKKREHCAGSLGPADFAENGWPLDCINSKCVPLPPGHVDPP